MSSLKALKTRIQSVESTKKITSAMYMVAAAKFRKAQKNVSGAKAYAEGLLHMFENLPKDLMSNSDMALLSPVKKADALIVLFAGDRGLCGGFNTLLLKHTQQYIAKLSKEKRGFKLMCIGQKALDFARKHYPQHIVTTELNSDLNSFDQNYINKLTQQIEQLFNSGTCSDCLLIFNTYTSPLVQTPTVLTLLGKEIRKKNSFSTSAGIPEFSPSTREFLENFIYQYIKGVFFSCYTQTVVGEYAARMSAMDSSTNNCNEMINTLKLEYNQQRQDKITKELVEIISGAEALQKG